jgi:hypothetical protein
MHKSLHTGLYSFLRAGNSEELVQELRSGSPTRSNRASWTRSWGDRRTHHLHRAQPSRSMRGAPQCADPVQGEAREGNCQWAPVEEGCGEVWTRQDGIFHPLDQGFVWIETPVSAGPTPSLRPRGQSLGVVILPKMGAGDQRSSSTYPLGTNVKVPSRWSLILPNGQNPIKFRKKKNFGLFASPPSPASSVAPLSTRTITITPRASPRLASLPSWPWLPAPPALSIVTQRSAFMSEWALLCDFVLGNIAHWASTLYSYEIELISSNQCIWNIPFLYYGMCLATLSIKARSTKSLIGYFVAFQICEPLQINPTTMELSQRSFFFFSSAETFCRLK